MKKCLVLLATNSLKVDEEKKNSLILCHSGTVKASEVYTQRFIHYLQLLRALHLQSLKVYVLLASLMFNV